MKREEDHVAFCGSCDFSADSSAAVVEHAETVHPTEPTSPGPCGRCKRGERVAGKRVCAECLPKLCAIIAGGRRVLEAKAETTATHRTCSRCKTPKLHRDFGTCPSKDRRRRLLLTICRECRTSAEGRRRRAHGQPPMRRREERDGKLRCNRCADWFPRSGFPTTGKSGGVDSWCRECKRAANQARRSMGNSLCECGEVKDPGEEACAACTEIDGVTQTEGTLISALRVLGGEAQMAAIVEDIGGDINEDPNGAGYRRAYRGLAALRSHGLAETRMDKVEAAGTGGEIATHRLRRAR